MTRQTAKGLPKTTVHRVDKESDLRKLVGKFVKTASTDNRPTSALYEGIYEGSHHFITKYRGSEKNIFLEKIGEGEVETDERGRVSMDNSIAWGYPQKDDPYFYKILNDKVGEARLQ